MFWRLVKNKYVITKDGVNFALTKEELDQLKLLISNIQSGQNKFEKVDNR